MPRPLLTSPELQALLEWAGARLAALPATGLFPSVHKVAWPEYSQDKYEVLLFRKETKVRAPAPSPDEIPIMEQILLLPNICARPLSRRILHLRAIVHPITYWHTFNWPRIAKKIGSDPETVKLLHKQALREVLAKTPPATLMPIITYHSDVA